MVKLRTGPGTCHIKSSAGASPNTLHFYNTRYSNEYGLEPSEFTPRKGRHTGTGYSSNFRPQLYYSRTQDNFDNPVMGFLLSDNYETVTKRHYQGNEHPSIGIPGRITGAKDSGFIRERPLTVPDALEVSSVFYNTKRFGGKSFPGIPPRHKAPLHKIKRHDPVEEENHHRGPRYMSTETKAKFLGDPTAPLNIHQKDIGTLENSGFTDNQQIEPITHLQNKTYGMDDYGQGVPSPGRTVMQSSFMPWHDVSGGDPLPEIRARTSKDTGFIKEQPRRLCTHRRMSAAYLSVKAAPELVRQRLQKNDPAEYLNMKHPDNKTSITSGIFEGKQRRDRSQEMLLDREHRGTLELSGDSLNNDRYEPTKNYDEMRYLTDYNMRFHDKTSQGVDREGWVMGGLQIPREDGYRRDFKVHSYGNTVDYAARIRRLDPYVAKSIRCKDRYFVDHVHQHKTHESSEAYRKALSTGTLQAA